MTAVTTGFRVVRPASGLTAVVAPEARPTPPASAWRRIGVFGGTFDPPHVGHLVTAVNVRHALDLDVVLLVVASDPWQKSHRAVTPAADRLAMVEAAVGDVAGLEASDLELRRSGRSYTADTLAELRADHPARRAVPGPRLRRRRRAAVVGACRRGQGALASIVVVTRPGSEEGQPPPGWDWQRGGVTPARGVEHRPPRPRRRRPAARLPPDRRRARLHRGPGLYRSRRMNWRRAGFVAAGGRAAPRHPVPRDGRLPGRARHHRGPRRRPRARPGRARLRGVRRADADRACWPAPTEPTLAWLALAALGGEGGRGGALLLVPADTRVADPLVGETDPGRGVRRRRAAAAWRRRPRRCSGPGWARSSRWSPSGWRRSSSRSSPLEVVNPDDVADFAAGPLALDGLGVVAYLAAADPDGSDLARLARHELRLAGVDRRRWPAPSTPMWCRARPRPGVGRFVRGLAAGPSTHRGDPGRRSGADGHLRRRSRRRRRPRRGPRALPRGGDARRPARGCGCSTASGPPGSPPGWPATRCGPAAQVTVIGNADGSGPRRSAVVYYDAALTPAAEAVAARPRHRCARAPGRTQPRRPRRPHRRRRCRPRRRLRFGGAPRDRTSRGDDAG